MVPASDILILYLARTDFQWRILPKGFPPRSTDQRYFYAWCLDGTSRGDAEERDQARHTLSAEETSVFFADAGVPRSVRTVHRFCKKGHLDCIAIDTEISEKYLIDRNSGERRDPGADPRTSRQGNRPNLPALCRAAVSRRQAVKASTGLGEKCGGLFFFAD